MLSSLKSAVAKMLGHPPPASLHAAALTVPPRTSVSPPAPAVPMEVTEPSLAPPEAAATPDPEQAVLTRNEVLNADLAVIGYEFALRADLRAKVRTQNRGVRDFLDNMLVDQLIAHGGTILRQRRAWVQLWESSLLRPLAERLPEKSCILLLPDRSDRPASQATCDRIAALRRAGYEVWLDDCALTPWFTSTVGYASGMSLRMALRAPFEITDTLEKVRREHVGLKRAAWEVGSFEDQALVKRLGCSVFSGGFLTHRGDWRANQLSPQVINVAMLINQVRQDADMREIARILKQDLAMSYRLLRYVNAAGQGLNHAISSIEQALLVMGQAQLDRWLTLLLLTGGAAGGNALMEVALTRARFLELLGNGRLGEAQCEQLFVLGLFSMLDVALQVPLVEAIRPLRLPEVMNRALLQHSGPMGAFLALTEACERGNVEAVGQHAAAIGLSVAKVNAHHFEALEWVARRSAEQATLGR